MSENHNKHIGILGGTFDPIHNGHMMLAEEAMKQFPLDEIWFMPSGVPPHKQERNITAKEHREQMVRLAIKDMNHAKCCDYEIKKETHSYTAETLTYLHELYPNVTFYFIMGADSLFYLECWYQPEVIMQHAVILAAKRDEKEDADLLWKIQELNDKYQADIRLLQIPGMKVSSSMLREMAKKNMSLQQYVPNAVEQYIREHRLY